jgi:hypothetical protein
MESSLIRSDAKEVHKPAYIYYTNPDTTWRPRHNSKPVCLWHMFQVPKK